MKNFPLLGAGAGVALAMLSGASVAFAQEAPSPAAPGATERGLDEIVVTAQRREEKAQDVPISITALGAEQLASLRSTADIAQAVPNIQLGSPIGFGIPRTGIRGVAQGDFNANATTSNMLYLDDVPLNSPITQGAPIWDLERVEVLRGPQGTLFGRNATGGAVRYISAMPKVSLKGTRRSPSATMTSANSGRHMAGRSRIPWVYVYPTFPMTLAAIFTT